MSRFFDLVSKPARDMGTTNVPGTTPAALERRAPLLNQLIKLDSNENPFGPSAHAIDAMRSALAAAGSYPDDDCSPLRLKSEGAGWTQRGYPGYAGFAWYRLQVDVQGATHRLALKMPDQADD